MSDRFQSYLDVIGEIGFVKSLTSSIAYVEGLPGIKLAEHVLFESGVSGQVMAIDEALAEILIFAPKEVRVGERVSRTNQRVELPVGEELLGRYIINNPGFFCIPISADFSRAYPLSSS